MNTREELDAFIVRADELIQSNYILAEIKIVNLLKSIASSKTILAIFENCLQDFDVDGAKKKYLVKSAYLSGDKGEFKMPDTTRELLAFVFYILVAIDNKEIDFSQFLSTYFYEDGSFSSGFNAFINSMIAPFRDAVKNLTESVISGELQNPVEALAEEEKRKLDQKEEQIKKEKQEEELSKKIYAENVKKIKTILLTDKVKIKSSKKKDETKMEILLVIDMLANAITSEDRESIEYAFISYKFMAKHFPFKFFGRNKKVRKLLQGVLDGL